MSGDRSGRLRNESDDRFRVPPHDLDAERSVIGAVLVSTDALERVRDVIGVEDFYSETHRIVYSAILRLSFRGEPVDQITVSEELRLVDEFDRIGGRGFVFSLVESVPVASNAHRYAEIVREKAIFRRLIDAGSRITEDAFRELTDAREAIENAERIVYRISDSSGEGTTSGGAASLEELAARALAEINERYESGVSPGVSSGFHDLDEKILGFHPGELIIVAARPAMGKTSLLMSLAKSAARVDESHALVFSLEMSEEQITYRLISQASGIPVPRIMQPTSLRSEDFPRLLSATNDVSSCRMLVEDDGRMTVGGMRSRIRREAAKLAAKGERLSLVAVDYLQLMDADDTGRKSENRQTEVSEISRGLKLLAREFSVPVIALSQLSRACEARQDKRPMLSDLRDSGSLEQDADKVMFLYRDDYYNPDSDDKGTSEVIIGKHRNGPTGTVRLAWLEQTAEFASLSRQESDVYA